MNQDKKKSPCTAGTVTEANIDNILSISEIGTDVKPTMKICGKDYPIMVGQTYTADEVKAYIEESGIKPSDRVERFLINLGLYGYLDAFIDYINVGGTSVDGFFSLL